MPIESLDPIYVEFSVPQQHLETISVGKQLRIAGSGLADRLWEMEQRLAVGVNAVTFGATGDGVADDGPAINQAIQAAQSLAGNGVVVLNPGTYLIGTQLLINTPVTIQGSGWGTVLRAKNSLNNYVIKTSLAASYRLDGCSFRDFKIDGGTMMGMQNIAAIDFA